ncbi:hypothetical protein ACFL5F_06805, partial [Planctomycetota bacterium]
MNNWISAGIALMVLLFGTQVVYGSEEPSTLGEQNVSSVTDDQGVIHNIGYIWTNFFDYKSDVVGTREYDTKGSMHGVTYSVQERDGTGMTLSIYGAEDIDLTG